MTTYTRTTCDEDDCRSVIELGNCFEIKDNNYTYHFCGWRCLITYITQYRDHQLDEIMAANELALKD